MNARASLAVIAVLLGGCAGQPGIQSPDQKAAYEATNAFPASYKTDILAFLRTYLNDPSNIRAAQISEPVLKPVGGGDRYVNCVRFNARKSGGDYAGSKDYFAIYVAGRLDRLVEAGRDQCGTADYRPFPELERLSR
jgi:hypothetical protein